LALAVDHSPFFPKRNPDRRGNSHITFDSAHLVDHLTVLLAGEEGEQALFGHHALPRMKTGSERERLHLLVVKAGRIRQ